jgi:hypothetical protein
MVTSGSRKLADASQSVYFLLSPDGESSLPVGEIHAGVGPYDPHSHVIRK